MPADQGSRAGQAVVFAPAIGEADLVPQPGASDLEVIAGGDDRIFHDLPDSPRPRAGPRAGMKWVNRDTASAWEGRRCL